MRVDTKSRLASARERVLITPGTHAHAARVAAQELKQRGLEEQYEAVVHEYSLLLTGQLEVRRGLGHSHCHAQRAAAHHERAGPAPPR